ncbi:MAG: enoyl-CoA hydratase [Rhodospirillales bacterium]|nr:enoyl-CoA hydratase [Rhodospirillales bacterium]
MAFRTIVVERHGRVGLVRLNRPQAFNALSSELVGELGAALAAFDADDAVGCMVLTGGDRAFAAGADIAEMKAMSFTDAFFGDYSGDDWDRVGRCRKPLIAAVAGYALGGGCEIAMMCDFVLAADTARFGHPEITIGTLSGAGGTQRPARIAGKSKAMEMALTGRMMDAVEAERCGLVSRVVPAAELLDEALRVAEVIAGLSRSAVMMAKEAVNRAYETTLSEGVRLERRLFHVTFATEDQKEGMAAFIEKRPPDFRNR